LKFHELNYLLGRNIISMVLRYILPNIVFPIFLFANDLENINIDILSLLLIPTIMYISYRIYIVYIKNQTTEEADELTEVPFNEDIALLDEGKELINFLKLNPSHTKIHNETYRVQNLLNEVYGLLDTLLQKNNIELVYDIDSSMPIELVGDSLHIEQALYNLLSTIITKLQDTTIMVSFKKAYKNDEILIQIVPTQDISLNNISIETTHALLKQLNAHLTIQDNISTIHLPFLTSPVYLEAYYSLPKSIHNQKVLLIEDNPITAKIIDKSIQYFSLDVTIQRTTQLTKIKNFSLYDIMIIDAKLLTPILLRHLEEIKTNKNLHIISLETLYGQRDRRFKPNPIVSKYLYKPLSSAMVFNFLYEIYVIQEDLTQSNLEQEKTKDREVVFIEETNNIIRESFQDFNHIHILVVEDNKINQKIIQRVLEKSKIQITIANNGQEALIYLQEYNTIDIILMDINMPIMDGYQATKKIRENDTFSSLPIVIVSGLGFRNEIEQMYLAGANAHLTKPFKIGQLYNAFSMFLNIDSQQENSNEASHSQYLEDTNILDIQKGTSSVQNILAYRDSLRETLIMLKSSDEKIKESIIKKDFLELYIFCNDIISDSESIGASNLTQVLNEILILLNTKEEVLLQNYIILYRDAWIKTKRNIELYLKSVNSY